MLDALSALILGLVEGFTEFLPISSTAHLNLASNLLGLGQTGYVKTFEIAIQSGAIFAVVALYAKKFLNLEVLKRIIVAFIPTGIVGFLFYKLIKTYLIGNTAVALSALALGGLFLILFEKWHKEPVASQDITIFDYRKSFIIGIFQSVAVIPGVSRAAATIVGGMLMGIRREVIVEFSFLLAVPTMLAATGFDVAQNINLFSSSEIGLLALGFVASFATAIVSIKFLLAYIARHTFTAFGWYRIAVVLAFGVGYIF